MIIVSVGLLFALQQGQDGAVPGIARIAISPAARTMPAGDTLRLTAQPLDAAGKPITGAIVRFVPAGGMFEATVDSSGLVTSGAVGTLPVTIVALLPGQRPVIERIEIEMLPGPAARIDVVPERARLLAGQELRLEARSLSAAGDTRDDRITWRSSAPAVASVDASGVVRARAAGRATITGSAGAASTTVPIEVVGSRVARIELSPSNPTARTGDVIAFSARVVSPEGRAITGLAPAWSIAPGRGMIDRDGSFVAYEPGEYAVTASFGAHTAVTTVSVLPRDVRRRANVLGRLALPGLAMSEVWVHPDGKHAYVGTVLGHDKFYALDVSDPTRPVITDSVAGSMRSINDVMATPDGKWLVYTREGAADRRNGIGIASLEDPAHPKPVVEFTDGVTAGVHSAFVYHQPKYGTHVFLTNDGTGAMNVVDITDPTAPRRVAEWKTERTSAGRMLHDIAVQDGLAYLSYWNDGLVILDVGNGIKGGSPSNPQLVSQYKYDLDALYRDVRATSGAGFVRGTHTAWRSGKYVFIADEVFGMDELQSLLSGQVARAYGRLQVLDVSDLERPRSVAWYEPEYGGVHNIWVAGDTLYLGAYNGGFRAFDISGELRGDLRAQGREIAFVHTGAPGGRLPNAAMTWGAVVKDGLVYVPDMNSGLWIVRMEPIATGLTP